MSARILPVSTSLICKKCTLYPAETSRCSTTVVFGLQGSNYDCMAESKVAGRKLPRLLKTF